VHWDGAKPQNCVVQKFCTKVSQTLLFVLGTKKKSFLSISNVIISQFVWSTFAILFAYVLFIVEGKILRLKVEKGKDISIWASWTRNGRFGVFFEENGHGLLGSLLFLGKILPKSYLVRVVVTSILENSGYKPGRFA
jgi:uncharacterized membrane protein